MESTLEAISGYTLPQHTPTADGGLVPLGDDKYILVTQADSGDKRISKVGCTTQIASVTGKLRPQWNQDFVEVTHISPLLVEEEEAVDPMWDWLVRHRTWPDRLTHRHGRRERRLRPHCHDLPHLLPLT